MLFSKNQTKIDSTSFFMAILLLASLFSADLFAQPHDDPRWVTTWATSPSTLPATDETDSGIENQTLRLIVHTSAGGSSLRLRLSNTHGNRPLRIGAATIALQSQGSSIKQDSTRQLRFNENSDITIARGATVFSDPLEFDVPALTNLSVSLYLPTSSGFLTAHALSNQQNYISAAGDHTSASDLPIAEETSAWSLLTAIDVINDDDITTIALTGDSITDGWGSTSSANQRWPNHFTRRLFEDSAAKKFAVINAGISGNRVTTAENPLFGQNLQARFERDVLSLSKVSHIVVLEGINDIGMSPGDKLVSASEIIAGYQQILARAHARGIKVIGATLTPFEGAAYFTPAGEEVRQSVNTFIRNSGQFDAVLDFDKVMQDPEHPARLIPSFTADNLHPNDAGYKAMADSIDLSLFR